MKLSFLTLNSTNQRLKIEQTAKRDHYRVKKGGKILYTGTLSECKTYQAAHS